MKRAILLCVIIALGGCRELPVRTPESTFVATSQEFCEQALEGRCGEATDDTVHWWRSSLDADVGKPANAEKLPFVPHQKLPKDLAAAVAELEKMLPAKDLAEIAEIAEISESEMIGRYHFGLGTWMRNNWGLWGRKSKLALWFMARGVNDPEAMSSVVLESLWNKLHGEPLDEFRILTPDERVEREREEAAVIESLNRVFRNLPNAGPSAAE